MITDEIVRMDSIEFADILPGLDEKTCERHARKIADLLSGTSYETYKKAMVNIVRNNAQSGKHNTMDYFQLTATSFPGVSPNSDILEKLVGLTLMSITLRLEKYQEKEL